MEKTYVQIDEHRSCVTYNRGRSDELGDIVTVWFFDNQVHREDGPARIWSFGRAEWWQHNDLHRVDGPAIIQSDGTQWWYLNGIQHREDGPAVEWADGKKEWWIKGREMTQFEHWLLTSTKASV